MTTTIPLTRATQDTIANLRDSVRQTDLSSERISTGKAVNSALDNPNSYFTSKALSNHAAELDRVVEQLGQGIQVITSASNGIQSISKLLESSNSVARNASNSSDAFARIQYAKDYNGVLDQVLGVAKDSGYRGKNLLLGNGHDLKLYFGDNMSEAVTVQASDFTNLEQTLGLSHLKEGKLGLAEIHLTDGTDPLTASSLLVSDATNFSDGDQIVVNDADGNQIGSLSVTADTRVSDLISTFSNPSAGLRAGLDATGVLKIESAQDMTISGGSGAFATIALDAEKSDWFGASGVDASIEDLKGARDTVRLQETSIGTSLTMLQNRTDFMKSFSGALSLGSERLVSADLNEESAKLLALQTRQQLASSSLSMFNEADSGLLRLLGGCRFSVKRRALHRLAGH